MLIRLFPYYSHISYTVFSPIPSILPYSHTSYYCNQVSSMGRYIQGWYSYFEIFHIEYFCTFTEIVFQCKNQVKIIPI